MMGSDVTSVLEKIGEEKPDWKAEHDQQVQSFSEKNASGRQRVSENGTFSATKAAKLESQSEDNDIMMKNIQMGMQRLEHTVSAMIKMFEKIDASSGNSILVIRKN